MTEQSTAIATREERIASLDAKVLKEVLPGLQDCTDNEVAAFVEYCKAAQMDPWMKDAYLVKYSKSDPASVVVGNNYHVRQAAASPIYCGHKHGLVVQNTQIDPSGAEIRRNGAMTMPGDVVLGGWIIVYRNGIEDFEWTLPFDEYNTGRSMWVQKPNTMMCKTIESQGLRKGIPGAFGVEQQVVAAGLKLLEEEDVPAEENEALDAKFREVSEHPVSYPEVENKQQNGFDCPIHEGQRFVRQQRSFWSHATADGWCSASSKAVREVWGQRISNLFEGLEIEGQEVKQAWLRENFPDLNVNAPSKWTPADFEC